MTAQPAPMTCPSCGTPNLGGSSVCQNCTYVLISVPQVHAGFILASRYEITSALGAGGMGIVYQAQDRLLNETVALKVLRPEVAATPDMAQRFISEIKMARAVSHRNVCRIHEYGEDRGLRYISMAFVGGVDLRRLLRERGPLPPALAYDVAIQAAEGLQAVHEEGIVHRDLKPANITVDPRGVVRVMDFGLAKSATGTDLSSPSAGHMVGTPDYMSPEQIHGAKLDPRSDVYSMGIVTYELFTGRTPFRADTPVLTILRHLNEPPPLDGVETLPPALVPVLKKALQKEPALRYATAEALGHALEEARSNTADAALADFEGLFRGRETVSTSDPTQPSQSTWSSTEGLSQETWTTAVGRSVAEAVEAVQAEAAAVESEPVEFQALDDQPVEEHPPDGESPFFVEDVTAARASSDPVEIAAVPRDRMPSPRADEPTAAAALAQALATFAEQAAPARVVPSEPEEIGIEVPEPMLPTPPSPAPAVMAPAPFVAEAPAPAGQSPAPPAVEAAAEAPVARQRSDETARGRARTAAESSGAARTPTAAPPWAQAVVLVRAHPQYAAAAAALPVVLLLLLAVLRLLAAPYIASAEPTRVANGGTVVLTGTDFPAHADGAEVLVAGQPGHVTSAAPTRLTVELPELEFSWPEPERRVPVVVRAGSRNSAPFDLTVFPFPRIRSLTPEAGVPGDEVTITGSGWPLSASVRFGRIEAQVLQPGYKSITVRVPAVRAGTGGAVPVVVVVGQVVSSPVKFRVVRAQP